MRQFQSNELYCVSSSEGEIGRGGFGVVLFAFHDVYDVVAVKCFEVYGGIRKLNNLKKMLINELNILQKANHENIVRVLGYSSWKSTVAIVMEYLPCGNLMELVKDTDIDLNELLQLRICTEIAKGLSFIHNSSQQERIVHGDVKPENVLLTDDLHCKISDFGSAKISSYTVSRITATKVTTEKQSQYTQIYAAPECFINAMLTLKPSYDVFSFSILVYVVLSRKLPIPSFLLWDAYKAGLLAGQRPDLENILNHKGELDENSHSDEIRALETLVATMKECWAQDPSVRPKMLEVKENLQRVLSQISSVKLLHSVATVVGEMDMTKPWRQNYDCVPLSQIQLFQQHSQVSMSTSVSAASIASVGSSEMSISENVRVDTSPDVSTTTSASAASVGSSQMSTSENQLQEYPKSEIQEDPILKNEELEEISSSSLHYSHPILEKDYRYKARKRLTKLEKFKKFFGVVRDEAMGIAELVQELKLSLERSELKYAVSLSEKLISMDTTTRHDGYIIDDIIAVSKSLNKESKYLTSLKVIDWVSKICKNMEEPEIHFRKIFVCCNVINNVSESMMQSGMKLDIEKICLPLLRKMLDILKSIQLVDTKFQKEKETWCLLQIAYSYNRTDRHQLAMETSGLCLSTLTSLYGDDAKKHALFSDCYQLLGFANFESHNDETAREYWKQSIEALRAAEDIPEDQRKKGIEALEQALSQPKVQVYYY